MKTGSTRWTILNDDRAPKLKAWGIGLKVLLCGVASVLLWVDTDSRADRV